MPDRGIFNPLKRDKDAGRKGLGLEKDDGTAKVTSVDDMRKRLLSELGSGAEIEGVTTTRDMDEVLEEKAGKEEGPGFGEKFIDGITDSEVLANLGENLKAIGAPVKMPRVQLQTIGRTSPEDIMSARRNALMQMVRR